jgi:hypothetical protein
MKNCFRILLILLFSQVSALNAQENLPAVVDFKPHKAQEQLVGEIKTVFIEFSKINRVGDLWVPEELRIPWLSTTYNRQGFQIQEDQLYRDEALNFKSIFIYDTKGKLTNGAEHDYKDQVTFTWTYRHHAAQNMIEETRIFQNGKTFSRINYIYDQQGNLIEENHQLEQTKNAFSWVYQHDSDGRKTEESYYLSRQDAGKGPKKSQLNLRVVFLYDGQGNLVEETRHDATGQVTSNRHFQYEYDTSGNWITQTAREPIGKGSPPALIPTEITYRHISYHSP